GAEPDKRAQFSAEAEASAKRFEELTMAKAAEAYALGPTRVQHQNRDPRGWREFADQFKEHSTEGAALTMRGVQAKRPSLFELVDKMKTITVPTLIMTGDEDWPCIEPGVLMKKNIATAGLVVMPNAGHNINLEDPAAFNAYVQELFLAADAGTWPVRDPRAMAGSILGRGQGTCNHGKSLPDAVSPLRRIAKPLELVTHLPARGGGLIRRRGSQGENGHAARL